MVCPKCREHAQVLEQVARKTTKCQHCGALLRVRKLRIFFSSDELPEAVAVRTRLQAGLSGKEAAKFFEKLVEGGPARVPAFDSEKLDNPIMLPVERAKKAEGDSLKISAREILFELLETDPGMDAEKLEVAALGRGVDLEKFEKLVRLPAERAKKADESGRGGPKKNAKQILFELLEASGGKMDAGKLEAAALERGLGPEMFENTLKDLQAAREIYSPSKGVIKIV